MPRIHVVLLVGLGAAAGCKKSEAAPPLANESELLEVPTPPADGPKLVALANASVLARPSPRARPIGALQLGEFVARSAEPYGRDGCTGGYYAVRPRGFVCVGDAASLDTSAHARAGSAPDPARPLPFRYARTRVDGVPFYLGVPSPAQQEVAEPGLTKRPPPRSEEFDKELYGASPNDVPLDDRGVATGPPMILPTSEGVTSGRRTAGAFFTFADGDPPVAAAADAPKPPLLPKGAGLAVVATYEAPGPTGPRRFAATPDGHVVPLEMLRPALGTTTHGLDLAKLPLPVGFVHHRFAKTYSVHAGKVRPLDQDLERQTGVYLSGRFRSAEGARYEETRDGVWLKADDLVIIVKRSKLPDFAQGEQKWVDVSLANQTMTLYEGKKAIYAALISSGRDVLKDPETTASTARGTFHVRAKYVTKNVDGREAGVSSPLGDVPWYLEFAPGFAVTGSYWLDTLGEARGFHDVTLAPIDARRLWTWAEPRVPDGWRGVEDGEGTIVAIRP